MTWTKHAMTTPILPPPCRCVNCHTAAIASGYLEYVAELEQDLIVTRQYLASALKLVTEEKRARSTERMWNQVLRDENAWLRETLKAEREIRNQPTAICNAIAERGRAA